MIVELRIENLPDGAVPAYDVGQVEAVRVYDFRAGTWVFPTLKSRIGGKYFLSPEFEFRDEKEIEMMVFEAARKSASPILFAHISFHSKKIGIWESDMTPHPGLNKLSGTPETVSKEFYSIALAEHVMGS